MKLFTIDDFTLEREKPFIERDPTSIVDPVYIDREKQIAAFIRSGERLRASRSSFEYPDGDVPEGVQPDPTSVIGFDLADASALQKQLQRKVAQVKAEGSQGNAPEGVPAKEIPEENCQSFARPGVSRRRGLGRVY